jgi:hypothetical protein
MLGGMVGFDQRDAEGAARARMVRNDRHPPPPPGTAPPPPPGTSPTSMPLQLLMKSPLRSR